MASLPQWTWVWATSGRWWRTEKPGMLQSMGLQRVGHNWATEQQSHLIHLPWLNNNIWYFFLLSFYTIFLLPELLIDMYSNSENCFLAETQIESIKYPFDKFLRIEVWSVWQTSWSKISSEPVRFFLGLLWDIIYSVLQGRTALLG